MNSPILQTATRVMMPLLILFAIFLFLRGHDSPGGGFVAGLMVSIAFVLLMFSDGVEVARRILRIAPERLLGIGLLVALASGLTPVLGGKPFLSALWTQLGPEEWGVKIGTPIFFDLGVSLVVIGVVLTMTFTLAED